MIVSWNWLTEYIDLGMSHDDLVDRLTMSGLNHEGTDSVEGDQAIDLEVTSNRPDCLGHIGVAREIAALFDLSLKVPSVELSPTGPPLKDLFAVKIESPDLCYRFTASLIKGVKIGPSPSWLQEKLLAIGVSPVNNIVDISNYVMFECGQPLHTFDFSKLQGGQIIVRQPKPDEELTAIDHKTYQLEPGMCVIADANRVVGLGGVMGGADTEVSDDTVDILVEAAHFNPLSIRNTARKLNLFSAASYRFERTIDSANIAWANQRCCQLILEIAGGELCEGMIDVGQKPSVGERVALRYSQLERILGIKIPDDEVPKILSSLGFVIDNDSSEQIDVTVPSWRQDVTREVDLIEEVGRIYGYDKVPDNTIVPMAASHRPDYDRVLDKIRAALTSAGFDEAMTASLVPEAWSNCFSPWSDKPALESSQGMLGVLEKASQNIGAVKYLRRSLIPSLLEARRINEYKSNSEIELFETAKVYLASDDALPNEPWKIGLVSERDFFEVKGVIESIAAYLNPKTRIEIVPCKFDLFDLDQSGELQINGKTLGWIGKVSPAGKRTFGIRHQVIAAEIDFQVLFETAVITVIHQDQSPYPAITRDFNFIVENQIHWADLESTVVSAAGNFLESIEYKETFRDAERDGADKKRLLLSIVLRSSDQTMTGDEADKVCKNIVEQCQDKHSAQLVG